MRERLANLLNQVTELENEKEKLRRIALEANLDHAKTIDDLYKLTQTAAQVIRLLDGIKYDLEASVYTLTDDEFETVFFARDLLDEALGDRK